MHWDISKNAICLPPRKPGQPIDDDEHRNGWEKLCNAFGDNIQSLRVDGIGMGQDDAASLAAALDVSPRLVDSLTSLTIDSIDSKPGRERKRARRAPRKTYSLPADKWLQSYSSGQSSMAHSDAFGANST